MHRIHHTILNFAQWLLPVVLTVAVPAADANSYMGYKSNIEGVGLWEIFELNFGWATLPVAHLRFGENPEFAIYCDGRKKLFIYEKSSKAFTCRTIYLDGQTWRLATSTDAEKMRSAIRAAKKNKYSDEAQSAYYYVSFQNLKVDSYSGNSIYTVSKAKLLRGNWVVSTPTKDELESAIKVAKLNMKKIHHEKDYTYKTVLGYSNKEIKKLANRGSIERFTLKIRSGDAEVILLPTEYGSNNGGGDLLSSVLVHENDSYRFVGHVAGCLRSVGADLDSDGIPEFLFQYCDNTEGESIRYVKIFPEIRSFVTHSEY